ncbi:MAG: 16S rRNA (guanine(966)-N(2))-methyltransferase RsmD [Anaerolineae bacterium]|nr:16S rRNA (guanine(966)-N(2))-methyltransferase RsmD [Anaerolineae bacterium]MDW8098752.1 16S rRNA (guanine(966)-N(2))-methyltransferase RsmD [Anaerolineae bacterium]
MRVIAGVAKGRRLHSVPGETTRPITDRVKEALFDILSDRVVGCRFLDLFGGTGAVGIEALSRGAAHCTFVEKSWQATRTIYKNLALTGLSERAEVVRGDSFAYLRRSGLDPFDIIYVAPPQYRGLWRKALEQLDTRPELLTPDGLVIVQIHPREAEDMPLRHFVLKSERRYGSTLLRFYSLSSRNLSSDVNVSFS